MEKKLYSKFFICGESLYNALSIVAALKFVGEG
jgi:hypothetical protein